MQYGMPTLIENKTLHDNIMLCKELGLHFIELNMNFPEYQIDKLEAFSDFYNAADDAGIYYTIHLDENLNIADFNPYVRTAYLETVKRTIEIAKEFVALKNKYGDLSQPLTINMHMHHGIYITLPDKKVQMYDRDFAIYMDYFKTFRTSCEMWIGDSDIMSDSTTSCSTLLVTSSTLLTSLFPHAVIASMQTMIPAKILLLFISYLFFLALF